MLLWKELWGVSFEGDGVEGALTSRDSEGDEAKGSLEGGEELIVLVAGK